MYLNWTEVANSNKGHVFNPVQLHTVTKPYISRIKLTEFDLNSVLNHSTNATHITPLAQELFFFLILAHPVYKM